MSRAAHGVQEPPPRHMRPPPRARWRRARSRTHARRAAHAPATRRYTWAPAPLASLAPLGGKRTWAGGASCQQPCPCTSPRQDGAQAANLQQYLESFQRCHRRARPAAQPRVSSACRSGRPRALWHGAQSARRGKRSLNCVAARARTRPLLRRQRTALWRWRPTSGRGRRPAPMGEPAQAAPRTGPPRARQPRDPWRQPCCDSRSRAAASRRRTTQDNTRRGEVGSRPPLALAPSQAVGTSCGGAAHGSSAAGSRARKVARLTTLRACLRVLIK